MYASKSQRLKVDQTTSKLGILAVLLLMFGLILSNTLIQSEKQVIIFISILGSFLILFSTKFENLQKKPTAFVVKPFDFLGQSSFSIYIFHLPVMQLSYFLLGDRLQSFDVFWIYSVSIFSIFVSAALYFLFEKHTYRSRSMAYKFFGI
jgi:peptidoglycan/LPS O-acetylase OafA/YrhL